MGDWKKECTKNILRSFPGEDLKKYRVYCNLHNFRHLPFPAAAVFVQEVEVANDLGGEFCQLS